MLVTEALVRTSAYSGVVGAHDVRLVLDFLNTIDVEQGADELGTETGWLAWTSARQLRESNLHHAREVRAALRAALGDPVPDAEDLSEPLRFSLVAGVPTVSGLDAVGEVLAAAARLAVLGEWDRFKICPADTCRWAFFDRSRNRSRTWCSMQVCGNREKARAWRERTRATTG
jgi:predicted RNA-binding Zn ribbon-like protein